MHFYRPLPARFLARAPALTDNVSAGTNPLTVADCDLCHWRERCQAQRVADDHSCQVPFRCSPHGGLQPSA